MSLHSTVLFDVPQSEISSLLNEKLCKAKSVSIVTGFATVEGVKVLEEPFRKNPQILKTLIVGAGTFRAYEAFDQLIRLGVDSQNLFVHLGHTRLTKDGASHAFYRYHPMMHSKVYYIENIDGSACAVIGSHNMTGFALMGLNGEASIMLEGQVNDPEFKKIRNHIASAKSEAVKYETDMKEAFAWWTHQSLQGIVLKANDLPNDVEKKKTILVFCQSSLNSLSKNDILYFELLQAIGRIHSFTPEVHIYTFERLPSTPQECMGRLHTANQTFWCRIEGLEDNKGGKELKANWFIDDEYRPILKKAPTPFRPNPRLEMQQVRVRLLNQIYNQFDYLFGKQSNNWIPVLEKKKALHYNKAFAVEVEKLQPIQPETLDWFLVKNLQPEENLDPKAENSYQVALKAMEPQSGAFILFSTGRRKLYAKKERK